MVEGASLGVGGGALSPAMIARIQQTLRKRFWVRYAPTLEQLHGSHCDEFGASAMLKSGEAELGNRGTMSSPPARLTSFITVLQHDSIASD